jgi:hypothetical protein
MLKTGRYAIFRPAARRSKSEWHRRGHVEMRHVEMRLGYHREYFLVLGSNYPLRLNSSRLEFYALNQ